MLWYIEGSKIYLYYVINHEFASDFLVDKYFSTSTKLCFFKAKSPKLFGHFFNPYISMNLDDFELCVGPFAFDCVVYPIHETMCFKPTSHVLCANPCSSNLLLILTIKKLCFISIYDFFVLFPLLLVHMHMIFFFLLIMMLWFLDLKVVKGQILSSLLESSFWNVNFLQLIIRQWKM